MKTRALVLVLTFASLTSIFLNAQASDEGPADDVVARLGRQLDLGETTLDYAPQFGYLPSLLKHLDLNVDSQVLVFSKTSFQQGLISPRVPRALYFNDVAAVGTVPGGEVYELMALEPGRGIVFYTLDTKQVERPRFERRGVECLFCHGPGNHGAPGMVVASVIPNANGVPAYTGGFFSTTDHRTPFEERWGGWYVTGTSGSQMHLGNAIAPDPEHPLDLDQSHSVNLTSIADRFDSAKYLSPSSDIVALLTLAHQAGMTNLINGVSSQYRRAERAGLINDAAWARLDAAVDELVGYMLFVDEVPFHDTVKGVSTFTKTFPERGPRDHRGRSLRDFDLQHRLFRYPVSYMIYSDVFDRMPAPIRDRVYHKLYDVLTGRDTAKRFASLDAGDRRAAFEILLDTKDKLPAYWRSATTY